MSFARHSCTALAPSVTEPPPTVAIRSAPASRAISAASMTAWRGVCGGIRSNTPAQRLPSARRTLAISSVARFSVPLVIRKTRSAAQRRTSSATASAAGRPNVTASMLPNAIRPACSMVRPPGCRVASYHQTAARPLMTPEEFLGRVRALSPTLRERAPRAEQLRRLPDETVADFQEAGLFRAMQPKRYGGFELDPEFFYQAITEVGAVCGSSGWLFGVIGVHNWHLALFPPEAQQDVWGEDDSVQLSTSLAPTGKVERVEGGFRVSGRWSFSSGCDFCGWAVLGGIAPPAENGGPPDARTFLLPRSDYAIDDNWQVMGLYGSGSKDIVVTDAFVPD